MSITQKINFLQVLVKEKNVLDINHSQACVLPPSPPLTSVPVLHPSVPSLLALNLPLSPVGGPSSLHVILSCCDTDISVPSATK